MNITVTRKLFVTSAVGAAFSSAATAALLFLGAGTAQAVTDLPTTRGCASCVGFVPQPDPPSFVDRPNTVGIGNPNDRPGNSAGLGGPDTLPPHHN
jgi:hypothetical protein